MRSPAEWATTGNLLRITRWDEPVMSSPTRPVTDFGDELHQLVADMFRTMAAATGSVSPRPRSTRICRSSSSTAPTPTGA